VFFDGRICNVFIIQPSYAVSFKPPSYVVSFIPPSYVDGFIPPSYVVGFIYDLHIVVNFHNSLYYVWAYLCKATALGLIRIRVYLLQITYK